MIEYSSISPLEPLPLVIQNNQFIQLTEIKIHPESRTWNTLVNKLNYKKIHLTSSAIGSHGCDELQDPEFCLATHAVERSNTIFILVFSSFTYILKKPPSLT